MSVLRTIPCSACGRSHLLGQRCPCGGRAKAGRPRRRLADGIVRFVVVFVVVAAVISAAALAVAQAKGPGFGIATAVGAWLLLHACRLGYDWEEGIDIRMLLLPGPLDWSTKWQSLVNLLTSPRAGFRAAYFGGFVALLVSLALLLPSLARSG